ncbi:MAG TPA: DUF1572 family protein [Bacteroidia bacterium]|nr:DUF1572 family protein [Bacteroidia bacterium]
MKRANAIAKRFKETILDGRWVANTNFKDQLEGLDWKVATQEINSLNTIALLAQHIHYYIAGLLNVFRGGKLDIRDKYSFDFPPVESREEWEIFLTRFWNDAEAFYASVNSMPDEQLDKVFVDEKYGTFERNIEGIIEHSYYHLGQIVLLKKLLTKVE